MRSRAPKFPPLLERETLSCAQNGDTCAPRPLHPTRPPRPARETTTCSSRPVHLSLRLRYRVLVIRGNAIADEPSREESPGEPRKTPAPDPLVGRTLNGKYRLLELHARGGMSRIYRAEQTPLARLVAVKVLSLSERSMTDSSDTGSAPAREFARRFFREASLLAKIQHPNVVTVFDYGRLDGSFGSEPPGVALASDVAQFFTVMEFLDGRTLAQHLRDRGRLSPMETIGILRQILHGLRAAHAAGVVHRDLKPSNLMLVRGGESDETLKIVDFGIVKVVNRPGVEEDQELTREGVFVGSPRYMSPEQVLGKGVDPRSDLYSVGLIAYEMLSGGPPLVGQSTVETMLAQVQRQPLRLADLTPPVACPEWLERLIFFCLEKDKDARPANCDDVLKALRGEGMDSGTARIAAPAFTAPGSVPPGALRVPGADLHIEVSAPTSKRRRWALFALGAMVLAAAAPAAFHFLSPSPNPVSAAADTATAPPTTPPPAASSAASPPQGTAPAHYQLHVSTEPSGAQFYDGDTLLGRTPFELTVSNDAVRAAPKSYVLRLDGYEPYRLDASESASDVVERVALVARRAGGKTPRWPAPPAATKGATAATTSSPKPATSAFPELETTPPAPTKGLRPLDDWNPWEKK
jgi:eukaryotic-like serine/threonine-protein kinase